ARADAWIQPEYKQDNPLISLGTIIRTVFELFWLTWKGRHDISTLLSRIQRCLIGLSFALQRADPSGQRLTSLLFRL
ncbi:hypothetical protein, partial [Pantoea agglomerans]|uniref:hypothetical protein n=1 Tax=Enterobacter agglomerans TaxID=549 RepID=UPI001A8FC7AB